MSLAVGEVKEPNDQVFNETIKLFKDESEEWEQKYNKNNLFIAVMNTTYSDFKMIKIRFKFNISADVVYDTIHDEEFRRTWDKRMLEGFQICYVSPCSDITYYAMKSPFLFANRDFVTQRCWRVQGDEYLIFNHSVFHKNHPPKKDFVRGVSYVTGYFIKKIDNDNCIFTYLTQSDPRGHIPAWAINKGLQMVCPKTSKALIKAAGRYPDWKKTHNPNFKPWLYPEQRTIPKYNPHDILTAPDFDMNFRIDESKLEIDATIDDID